MATFPEFVGEGHGVDGERRDQAEIESDEDPAAGQDDPLDDQFQRFHGRPRACLWYLLGAPVILRRSAVPQCGKGATIERKMRNRLADALRGAGHAANSGSNVKGDQVYVSVVLWRTRWSSLDSRCPGDGVRLRRRQRRRPQRGSQSAGALRAADEFRDHQVQRRLLRAGLSGVDLWRGPDRLHHARRFQEGLEEGRRSGNSR